MNEQRLHQVFEASVSIPLKGQLWSYPASCSVASSLLALPLFIRTWDRISRPTVFDALGTVLMWNEYNVVRRQLPK